MQLIEQSVVLFVEGMRCISCVKKIEGEFSKLKELEWFHVDFLSNRIFLILRSQNLDLEFFEKKLMQLGSYKILKKKMDFSWNSSFIKSHEKEFLESLKEKFNFSKVIINYEKKKLEFHYLENLYSEKSIMEFFDQYGMKNLSLKNKKFSLNTKDWNFYFSVILLIPLTFFILAKSEAISPIGKKFSHHTYNIVLGIFSTPIIFFLGYNYYNASIKELLNKVYSMNTLITISLISSYLYSLYLLYNGFSETHFHIASFLVLTVNIGHWFENSIYKKRKDDYYEDFLALKKKEKVFIIKNNKQFLSTLKNVKIDDYLWIATTKTIPLDSILIKGTSYIDESMINGEVQYRKVHPNDPLYASSINHGMTE